MHALIIANTQIRRDPNGRYCLNDLHQASGGAVRHQPFRWVRSQQAQELIAELAGSGGGLTESGEALLRSSEEGPLHTVNDGFGNGTYAVKELVYAYAMWISAKFHLAVIRAYDAIVTGQSNEHPPPLLTQPQHRADQFVSAGRIFSAALRTARGLRMPPARAMRAAYECAKRNTGVDWSEELDAAETRNAIANERSEDQDLAAKIADYVCGRRNLSARDIILGAELGDPQSRALQMKVGSIMRELGWTKRRTRDELGRQSGCWRYSPLSMA